MVKPVTCCVLRRRIRKGGVIPLLEDEVLDAILDLDGGQGVDVLLEPLPGRLLLRRVGEPSLVVLDEVVICDLAFVGEHELAHGLEREIGRHFQMSFTLALYSKRGAHFQGEIRRVRLVVGVALEDDVFILRKKLEKIDFNDLTSFVFVLIS